MPSYVVTGATSGLGFQFLKTLSADQANTVIGLVRDETKAREKVAEELEGRQNVHIVHGDIGNFGSLKAAVGKVAAITGGGLDVLIANANFQAGATAPIGKSAVEDPKFDYNMQESFRVNVLGNAHLLAEFTPLIKKGSLKKVVAISSGMGDIPMVIETEMTVSSEYAIAKTALNMAVAKFHAQYKSEGILVMAISPGLVDTQPQPDYLPPDVAEAMQNLTAAIKRYAPDFTGPITPEKSVNMVLGVVEAATIEKNGGKMVSHFVDSPEKWL